MGFFHVNDPPRHHYGWKREWAKPKTKQKTKQKQKPKPKICRVRSKTHRVRSQKSYPMIRRKHLTLVWVNPNHLHFG